MPLTKTQLNEVIDYYRTHAPEIADIAIATARMNDADERGIAIIAGSVIEAILKDMVAATLTIDPAEEKQFFRGENAIAGSFANRIILLRYLALLTNDEVKDLRKIKDIRNEFAHKTDVSFETDKVKDLARGLVCHIPEEISDPVARFRMVCSALMLRLHGRKAYAAELRRPSFTGVALAAGDTYGKPSKT